MLELFIEQGSLPFRVKGFFYFELKIHIEWKWPINQVLHTSSVEPSPFLLHPIDAFYFQRQYAEEETRIVG